MRLVCIVIKTSKHGGRWSGLSSYPVEAKLMAKKLLIVVFILGLAVNGFAQKLTDEHNTTVYITTTDITVRDAPPSKGLILIGGPGKELFKLKKDDKVIVLERKVIESVLSKTIWIRIQDQQSKKGGWIYWGDKDGESVNLKEAK